MRALLLRARVCLLGDALYYSRGATSVDWSNRPLRWDSGGSSRSPRSRFIASKPLPDVSAVPFNVRIYLAAVIRFWSVLCSQWLLSSLSGFL